jgi:hypothetical protein
MTTEEAIESLDPTRDYGNRSYEQVVTEVESGALMVIPNSKGGHPILRQKEGGFLIKGSGRANNTGVEHGLKETKRQFMERAAGDFDSVYESVIKSATKGDVRAQKLFMELYVGRPTEAIDGMNKEVARVLAEYYLKSQGTRTVDALDV